jgi:glyoxylase-like metal-dependent hydrolase (beta-lactamase superfamily II)
VKDEAITPGNVVQLSPLVRRVTAPNPGVMTGPGTNTYLVGTDAIALIDPGPESAPHLAVLLEAAGKRIKWILCTHTHLDHSPGARALKAASGAELLGYRQVPDDGRQDAAFAPDRSLREGDTVDCGGFRLRFTRPATRRITCATCWKTSAGCSRATTSCRARRWSSRRRMAT